MFLGAENRRSARQRVAAHAFEHRRAIMDDVRHHVNAGVVPGYELAVMPDLLGFLNRHEDSSPIQIRCCSFAGGADISRGMRSRASQITVDYNRVIRQRRTTEDTDFTDCLDRNCEWFVLSGRSVG